MATTYYVDVAVGADGNAGTSAGAGNAWASIGKALDTATTIGDTVHVKASGVYSAQHGSSGAVGQVTTSITHSQRVLFEGYSSSTGDGGMVTVDASVNGLTNCINSSFVASTVATYHFINFRFTGATGDGVDCALWTATVFRNCSFDNNGGRGAYFDHYSSRINCKFYNNELEGLYSQTGTTFGCLIYNNSGNGATIGTRDRFCFNLIYGVPSGKYGIDGSTGNVRIINNTIIGNSGASFGTYRAYYASHIINNIITGFSYGMYALTGRDATTVYDNNLLYNNTTDNYFQVRADGKSTNITSQDPLFIDSTNGDFRLAPESPAIGAGIDGGIYSDSGNSSIDCGCFQRPKWKNFDWGG